MTDQQTPSPSLAPTLASRRGILIGAGVLATASGMGLAWKMGASGSSAGTETEPFPGFWALQWDTPEGGKLRAQDFRGKPVLINFWATWCPPCIEELPLINAFFRQHRAHGWQVIGLAVDRLAAVQNYLKKMPLDFPVGMQGADDGGLGGQLGNPSGALPYSLALGSGGALAERKLGRLRAEDLDAWAQLK